MKFKSKILNGPNKGAQDKSLKLFLQRCMQLEIIVQHPSIANEWDRFRRGKTVTLSIVEDCNRQALNCGREIIERWWNGARYSGLQTKRLVRLLDVEFLLMLPMKKGLMRQRTTTKLCFLRQIYVAHAVGWQKKRSEEDLDRFGPKINLFLWQQWWPN